MQKKGCFTMPKTALKLLIALGITASTACGGSGDSTSTDATSTETGTPNAGTTTAPETTTSAENLSEEEKALRALDAKVKGIYTFQVTLATETNLFGTPSSTETTFYGLATIARQGDKFQLTERPCRIATDSGPDSDLQASIKDIVPQSMEPIESEIEFTESAEGITFHRPMNTTLVGVNLADPENDDMPEDGDDSRIFDIDGDGKPGLTVSVTGSPGGDGDIYAVQRLKNQYDGQRESDGTLRGLALDDSDNIVLDATNPLLKLELESSQVLEKSVVIFKPIDSEYSCEKITAEIDTLFE